MTQDYRGVRTLGLEGIAHCKLLQEMNHMLVPTEASPLLYVLR